MLIANEMHWIKKKNVLLIVMLATAPGIRAGLIDGYAGSQNKTMHTFAVSVGPAWITSKVYTPKNSYSWRTGFEVTGEYNCVFSGGTGFGITYTSNITSYPNAGDLKQYYVGPSLVYAGFLGSHWHAKVDVGIGYTNCSDELSSEGGVGLKSGLSIEYLPCRNVGIGLEMISVSSYLGNRSDFAPRNTNERNGIARIGLTLGLRVHL